MLKPLSVVACLVVVAALFVGRAEAQTAAEVDGVWRGEGSGNEVRQTLRPGGDLAISAVTSNIQSDFQIFPRTGPYEWRSDTPGASALLRLQGGVFIVSMPSGFSDTFHRISAPPAATVAAPPPQRVLTTAEQENINAVRTQLDNSQRSLNFCREFRIGAFCAEFEALVAVDRQRLSQIAAQPSRPLVVADAERRNRLDSALTNLTLCAGFPPIGDLGVGDEPGRAAREMREYEQRIAACQPDMNAINGTTPALAATPTATQAGASIPTIMPQWRSSLAQSAAAAEARERDLRARSRRVHNGANDATDCLRVEATGVQAEWGTEGRMRIVNNCGYRVRVLWCANTEECETTRGNLWTIVPGGVWPIFFSDPDNLDIRIGACRTGAEAVSAVGLGGTFSERHLEPARAPPGVTSWSQNVCD